MVNRYSRCSTGKTLFVKYSHYLFHNPFYLYFCADISLTRSETKQVPNYWLFNDDERYLFIIIIINFFIFFIKILFVTIKKFTISI